MRNCFIGLLLALSVPASSLAQVVVSGTVRDASTGATLPAANIRVDGTYRGTITNRDGQYELRLDHLPATLVIRYIGYAEERRTVTEATALRQNFALEPVVYEAETVVVTGEDPAIRIMREVIERKKIWRAALETYEAVAYNRFAVSNDSGIVSIMETATQAFWDKERGIREVLKARRETSNMEFEGSLPAALFVTNLYDDDIDVSGHRLMGVTHPDALDEYRFRLAGTRRLNNRTVFDIDVAPKRKTKSAFVGRVSVLDSAFALIDVELAPGESFIFPPPLDRFQVKYQQQFSNFGGEFWLPVDFRAELSLKISFGLLLSFPDIRIAQVSRFTDYVVNTSVPDSLYETDDFLIVDSTLVVSDSLLATDGVAVPLSEAEKEAYVEIDSSLTMIQAFKPSGIFARFVEADAESEDESDDQSGRGRDSRSDNPIVSDWTFLPDVWYNRVDQFHLGGKISTRLYDRFRLTGKVGYNVAPDSSERWSYELAGRLRFGPANRAFLEGSYEFGSVPRYTSELYARVLNSAVLALGGSDYYDYYQREGFSVALGYGFSWQEATAVVSYRQQDHESLSSTIDRSPIGDRTLRPNPPIEPGRLKTIAGSFSIGDRTRSFGVVGANRVVAEVELGFGDFDYTRYAAAADLRIPTFYRRRLIPNTLDVHIVAGTHGGDLPPQRVGIVEGSLGAYRPFGGLRTLSDYPYEGDKWAGLFWEHSFRTIPFELLGWDWPVRKSYNLIVFGGHGRTWMAASDNPNHTDPVRRVSEQWHHEIGVSLSGLFGIARIDFAKRLDASGFTVGVAIARIF